MAEARYSHQLERNVEVIRDDVQLVSQQVNNVYVRQGELEELQLDALNRLETILTNTEKTLKDIVNSKNMQAANAEIIRLEEVLKKEFGHLTKIRRTTTGILQAVDIKIITQNALETTAQGNAIEAPGYWLAPALVSICYWIKNDKEDTKMSVKSALARSNSKASLFYALTAKRFGRFQSARSWMIRYFKSQAIDELNRETIFVLNALANNSFGKEVRKECLEFFVDRADEYLIKDEVNHENQVEKWHGELDKLPLPELDESEYNRLQNNSTNWDAVERTIKQSRSHEDKLDFFEDIFGGEIFYNPKITAELDELLNGLVRDPEAEELQYKSQLAHKRCVIKHGGDLEEATDDYESSKNQFAQSYDCGEVFINATMHPDIFNSTKGTQRLAASLSKPHLTQAYQQLKNEYDEHAVQNINLKIGTWTGITTDGTNELELVNDLEKHINERREIVLKAVSVKYKSILIAFGIIAVTWLLGGFGWLFFLGLLAAGYFAYREYTSVEAQKKQINLEYSQKLQDETNLLKALTAEVVEMREEMSASKAHAEKLNHLFDNLDYHQYITSQYDKNKQKTDAVANQNGDASVEEMILSQLTDIAKGLPEWDLMPPESTVRRKKQQVV